MQAVEAGVNGYILKPFTPQVLKDKITQIMGDVVKVVEETLTKAAE